MPEKVWVPLCERGRLSLIHVFAITLNQLTASLIWIPCTALLNPMLQKLEVSNAITTIVYLVGPIAGGTIYPFLGVIADNSTFKFGRRRPFIFIGEVICFTGMMFLSFADRMSDKKPIQILCLFIGQILAMYGGNIVSGPGRALVGDVVPQGQQVIAAYFCMTQSGFAGIFSNTFGAVKLADKFSGLSFGYEQFVLLVTSVIGLIALAISCVVSREEPLKEKKPFKNPLVSMWQVIKLYNVSMWLVGFGFMFFSAGTNQVRTWLLTFMGKNIFEGSPGTATDSSSDYEKEQYDLYDDGVAFAQQISVYQTIFQVIFGLTGNLISNKIGLKWMWTSSMTSGLISCLLFNIKLGKEYRYFYVVPCFFLAFTMMTGYAIPMAIASLYLDAEQMGGAQGVMNTFNCTGQLIAMLVLQLGFGSLADKYWKEDKSGFHYGNIIGLGSVFLFCAIICGFFGVSGVLKASASRGDTNAKSQKVNEEEMSSSV